MPSTWESTTPSRSRFVTQTLVNEEGLVGNCLQAAVATVLNKPIEMVPHFAVFPNWEAALRLYLVGQGFTMRYLKDEDVVNGLHLGMSPRGFGHALAVVDGGVWDPHPSRAGLITRNALIEIEALEPVSRG